MNEKKNSNLLFLSPSLTINNSHLTKHDVKNIKYSLLRKICVTCLVTAFLLLIVNLVSLIAMGNATGWNQVEKYGLSSLLGQIVSIAGTSIVIILTVVSLISKNNSVKDKLAHIANVLIFVVMIAYMFLSFYADASQGFLSVKEALSPSIALISLFLLIQPVFWIEAIVLDGAISIGLITLSIIFAKQYNILGLMYYLFVAVLFLAISYVIVSILFYAETQRYIEELRNETLHNTATYDELTLCKNRHALKESIQEFTKRHDVSKENMLLVMMFDIDDFKLYNDQYSHIGGDYCLKAIADSVRKVFLAPSLDFYRYGGEEFLLFFEVEDKVEAKELLEKVRKSVESLNIPAPKGAPYQNVTISIGGTLNKSNEVDDFNALIKIADESLYKAKHNGKNISVLDGEVIAH